MQQDKNETSATSYEIRVAGRIGEEWAEWFGGMALAVQRTEQGAVITVLCGSVRDRAALFGILNRIRDLGLRLISVNELGPQEWGPEKNTEWGGTR